MYFSSWTEFFNMGGHGLYVWSSYLLALVVVVYNLLAPMRHRQRVKAQVIRQDRLQKVKNNRESASQRTKPDARAVLSHAIEGNE